MYSRIKFVGSMTVGIAGVRLQRLSDYQVFLSTVKHGDCPTEYGLIRGNVGLPRCCRFAEVVRLSSVS